MAVRDIILVPVVYRVYTIDPAASSICMYNHGSYSYSYTNGRQELPVYTVSIVVVVLVVEGKFLSPRDIVPAIRDWLTSITGTSYGIYIDRKLASITGGSISIYPMVSCREGMLYILVVWHWRYRHTVPLIP